MAEEGKLQRFGENVWERLNRDLVEVILARLPLLSVEVAKRVCKQWYVLINTPQFDALHTQLAQAQPRLILYGTNYLVPRKSQAFAFDPVTGGWELLPPPSLPPHNLGTLAGREGFVFAISGPSKMNLRYKLSPTTKGEWREAGPMSFPRSAPVVGLVQKSGSDAHMLIVAGGVPDYEPEHLAVEVFDSATGAWEILDSLPSEFRGGSSRHWITGALCNGKFYVSQIHSWCIVALDLQEKRWIAVQWMSPPSILYSYLLSFSGTLLLAGVCRDAEGDNIGLKLWSIDPQTSEYREIGCMPKSLLAVFGNVANEAVEVKCLLSESLLYVFSLSCHKGYPVVVGEISPNAHCIKWQALPNLPASGFRFDHMVELFLHLGELDSV